MKEVFLISKTGTDHKGKVCSLLVVKVHVLDRKRDRDTGEGKDKKNKQNRGERMI